MIKSLPFTYDVNPLVKQIEAHPEVWNTHKLRTELYGTPHGQVSDIWVRYNDWSNFDGDLAAFNGPHDSVWYPVCDVLTEVKSLVERLFQDVGGKKLGGVLITKVPAGGEVKPHVDGGWHAGHYEKFAIQLKGNRNQGFYFDNSSVSAISGESYTFDNSKTHWVKNPTQEDRMTLIICLTLEDACLPAKAA